MISATFTCKLFLKIFFNAMLKFTKLAFFISRYFLDIVCWARFTKTLKPFHKSPVITFDTHSPLHGLQICNPLATAAPMRRRHTFLSLLSLSRSLITHSLRMIRTHLHTPQIHTHTHSLAPTCHSGQFGK
jgi:hypothetical protein